ncbi:tyrosyl-DNA phosphodiesterase 2 isoform X1 [Falco cherrug]|uniref:tyrosyl-DNA phosphodiesterase 2 isoform X1 n=1 Tax=Falco cherrug TaxID=345164 RepID=UPI00247A3750|nr:tyrosyl-DNA phosphodiesterase 2 isoform X1 [Falco cherrug]
MYFMASFRLSTVNPILPAPPTAATPRPGTATPAGGAGPAFRPQELWRRRGKSGRGARRPVACRRGSLSRRRRRRRRKRRRCYTWPSGGRCCAPSSPPSPVATRRWRAASWPAAVGTWSIDLTADAATTSNAGVNSADSRQQEDDSSFSLITWNIDGLDLGSLKERAGGICSYLALYSPDVVFLQEVILPQLSLLQVRAGSYAIIPGAVDGYFTAIMLKKSRVKLLKQEIIPFPTTAMMRNLLVVHVSISGNELCLMTSHLESTKNHSKERMKQLQIVLDKMQKESESTTVIFGGDTNLRDNEVTKLGGLPNNILDIWEFLGKPQHCRYTWDTHSNTNLRAEYKCKMRFDRVYIRPAVEGGHIIPRSMDLIGLEKLECGRFASDHWGLLCNFDVVL